MIKILFFIPGLSGGGAEKVLRNLVNNMDQSKFDITVQTIEYEDPQKYLVSGIHYKAINNCKTILGKKIFSYWFRLCAELKLAYYFWVKGDYDIEVAYLETIATKIISQSTTKKTLKLAWVHCDLSKKIGIVDKKLKIQHQYQKFDQVICVSQDAKKSFETLFGNCVPSTVVYNLIDETEIIEKANKKISILNESGVTNLLAIGRLSEEKAFDRLINVCVNLRNENYRIHLMILGDGPQRVKLENLIKKNNLENIVELVGFVDNPYPYMKQTDYIICSSKTEALSTVILESLILGKAIITTACSGMRELLGDSEYGLVVENSEEGIYHGIRKMLDSNELKCQYEMAAKKRGIEFQKLMAMRKIEELFMDQLRKKQFKS